MRGSLRKILVFAICLSLAIANGFTPRHAHAMAKVAPAVSQAMHEGHDHTHHHDHDAMADGHAHDHGMGASVAHPAKSDHGKSNGLTDNCCVASCSAIALIFATIDLSPMSLATTFVSSRENSLVLAVRTTDDPPPR